MLATRLQPQEKSQMKVKLTPALRKAAEKTLGVNPNAGPAAYAAAIKKGIADGTMSAATVNALAGVKATAPAPAKKPAAKTATGTKAVTQADVDAMVQKAVSRAQIADTVSSTEVVTPAKAIGSGVRIRVKGAAENYETSRKSAHYPERMRATQAPHPFAGRQAKYGVKNLEEPSMLDKAVVGAWMKWCLNSEMQGKGIPANLMLTDHDKDLVLYAMHNYEWAGSVKGRANQEMMLKRTKMGDLHIKALLDDTVSGGIEITPSVFDDAIILYPVLYGELFPFVNLKQTVGRRIKGGSMLNPVITSGTPEGAPIQPIDTSAFFRGFDTPIQVASGAMQVGLDFEEDTPVDFGSAIIEKFQEVALQQFDRWVAVGNGVSEPLGIFNTPNITVILSDAGVAGPPTVSDYEGMLFGIQKQYRAQADAMVCFVSNDTTYARSRGIRVGATDQRRVFGMDYENYQTVGHPHKVQNDIPNSRICAVNLRRYRMYQRAGTTVRVETAGRQLALTNSKLIVVRMRYGGQLEDANAAAIMLDAAE